MKKKILSYILVCLSARLFRVIFVSTGQILTGLSLVDGNVRGVTLVMKLIKKKTYETFIFLKFYITST